LDEPVDRVLVTDRFGRSAHPQYQFLLPNACSSLFMCS
jgi:hypothetical protein